MTTIAEIKSAFYDAQNQQAALFNNLVNEIVALNEKLKEVPVKEEKKKG